MSIWVDASGWPVPPAMLLGCLVAEVLYFRGWRVLVKAEQAKTVRTKAISELYSTRAGEFRWDSWFWRGTYFLGAVIITLIASSASVDILSGRLFWVHMIQHLLLLVIIAPLLVAGAPLLPMWLGLPGWARKSARASSLLKKSSPLHHLGHWLRNPVVSCALMIFGMWSWHLPALYDLALTNPLIHDWCEHLTFLLVSFIFWSQVIPSPPLHLRLGYLGRIVYLGVAIVQNMVLAILLAFSPGSLYAPYAHLVTAPGGLSALQ